MIILVALRNVWRNRTRSLVIMSAIALGICTGIFMIAFSWAVNSQRMRNIINTEISHIQLHHPKFREDLKVKYFLPDGMSILQELEGRKDIKAVTGRFITTGVLSDARGNNFGVIVHGVDPAKEAEVTKLDSLIALGEYFTGTRAKPILIGRKMAEKLKLDLPEFRPGMPLDSLNKLGRKPAINLSMIRPDEEAIKPKFRIVGIYDVQSSMEEETNVYVRIKDLQGLMEAPNQIHEIALLINGSNQLIGESEDLNNVKQSLISAYPEVSVEDWKELSPDLRMVAESFGYITYIFMGIIMLALLFGIVNTMLMAVMERKRELGMLLSVGMSKIRVFLMIMWETIFLLFIAAPIGMLVGFLLVQYFGSPNVGIDLSAFAQGAESLGVSSMAYPYLELGYYVEVLLLVIITAIVASLIPGLTAIGLKKASLRILIIAPTVAFPVVGSIFMGMALWSRYPIFTNTVDKSRQTLNFLLVALSLIPIVSSLILIYYLIIKGDYELKPVNSIR